MVGLDLVLRVEAVDHEGHNQSIAISKIKDTEHFAGPRQQGIDYSYANGQWSVCQAAETQSDVLCIFESFNTGAK